MVKMRCPRNRDLAFEFALYISTSALFWFLGHIVEEVTQWHFHMTKCIIVVLRTRSSIVLQGKIHEWMFLEELTFEIFYLFFKFFVLQRFHPSTRLVKNLLFELHQCELFYTSVVFLVVWLRVEAHEVCFWNCKKYSKKSF